jgi:hypothetical protein
MAQEIKPAYVTFEQAKKFKEKGYEIDTDEVLFCRDEINNIEEHQLKNRGVIYNATSINYKVDENEYRIYHQWEFVEWLRVNHGIWVGLVADCDYKFKFEINTWSWYELEKSHRLGHRVLGETMWDTSSKPFDSPQEAYSAAFDYILNNNLV